MFKQTLIGNLNANPLLTGVCCAFVASIASPVTFLTAVLIIEVDPMMTLLVRSLEHVVFFVVILAKSGQPSSIFVKEEIVYVMGRALSQTISMASYYSAQTKLPAADVGAIRYSSPLFATVGGYLFLKEKFGVVQGVGAVAVVVGALFISKPMWLFGRVEGNSTEDVIRGTTLAIVSCVFLASQTLFTRKLQITETSSIVLVDFVVCSLATLTLLLINEDFRYPNCGWSVALCLLGGVTAIITNSLTVLAGKLIRAGHLSVIRSSSIFFTYIFQIWLLGLVPTWHSIVGASLILLSLVATTLKCDNCQKPEKTQLLRGSTRH